MTMMHDECSSDALDTRILKRKGDRPDEEKPLKKSKHCRASKAKWTPEEDEILTRAVMMSGEGNWKKIAQSLNDRSHLQCLHRWQKVLNPALVKGPWKEEEDAKLSELVEKYGPKDWSTIASHIPGRIGKQCRERWFNHLSPDVRKTNWTPEEDKIIIDAHSKVGNKWTNISKMLDGRPANAIKNHWNSTLLKRIQENNGEPTPRRDRNRNKKPPPMRATEFDFRTQMLHQQFDESSDCSPQQYSQHVSPVSSPDTPFHHDAPMANAVRFQLQDAPHVFFPFHNEHHVNNNGALVPISNNTCSVWDSWPAPNVIHINPPPPPVSVPIQAATHNMNLHQFGTNTHTPINNNNFGFHQNVLNTMNVYDTDYSSISSSSLSEASSPEDFIEMYTPNNVVQGNSLPVELQYCFDHSQPNGAVSYDNGNIHSTPLAVDSSGMNINSMGGINVSNLGLLGLDLPSFCPLDL